MHMGQGPGITQNYTEGEAAGVESVTLTAQQTPIHTHPLVASTNNSLDNSPTNNVLAAGMEVIVDVFPVPEIIRDDAVDVRQIQRRKAVCNGFRLGTVVELFDHNIEQHLRVAHAEYAMFIHTKRAWVGLDVESHVFTLLDNFLVHQYSTTRPSSE